jgi:hypothetical protein
VKKDIKFILLLDSPPLAKLVSAIAAGDSAGGITVEFFCWIQFNCACPGTGQYRGMVLGDMPRSQWKV